MFETNKKLIEDFLETVPKSNKLTFKHVKTVLNQFGISINKNIYGEYSVNYKNGKESTRNLDTDLESSYHTGLLMVIHKDKWNV